MSGDTQFSSSLSGKVENISTITLKLYYLSMMGFISYYGHVQNTSNLGDNIFKSHTLGALVEVRRRGQKRMISPHSPCDQIPAWSAPFIINRCGRRGSQATFFLLSTVFSCGYALICQVMARATCHPDTCHSVTCHVL